MSEDTDLKVSIFDDFEEAEDFVSYCCDKVSQQEYEQQMASTTDTALGELCAYLDQHPEVYARILRKRKQEEIENAGVISFMKSKVMSILHGERVPECLVSTAECVEQTNALKNGICKTFQLSQELSGRSTRHSERLAAKRKAKIEGAGKSKQDGEQLSKAKRHNPGNDDLQQNFSESSMIDPTGFVDSSGNQQSEFQQNAQVPIPPPPPPLPPLLTTAQANTYHTSTRRPLKSKGNVVSSRIQNDRCASVPLSKMLASEKPLPLSASKENHALQKTESCVSSPAKCLGLPQSADNKFLTPMQAKLRKRSLSNPSLSQSGSLASIHTEIKSCNPLTRLKATQIERSPGGTPVRRPDPHLSALPLHRALLNGINNKFKNVKTPSPSQINFTRSGRSSAASATSEK